MMKWNSHTSHRKSISSISKKNAAKARKCFRIIVLHQMHENEFFVENLLLFCKKVLHKHAQRNPKLKGWKSTLGLTYLIFVLLKMNAFRWPQILFQQELVIRKIKNFIKKIIQFYASLIISINHIFNKIVIFMIRPTIIKIKFENTNLIYQRVFISNSLEFLV